MKYFQHCGNILKRPTDSTFISLAVFGGCTFICRSNWQKIAYAVAVVFLPPSKKKKRNSNYGFLIELLPGVGPALNRREEHFFYSFHEIGHIRGQMGSFCTYGEACVFVFLLHFSLDSSHIFLKACTSNAIFN